MKNSIVVKLGLSIVFLFLVVLFPIGYVMNTFLTNFYHQQVVDHLNAETSKIISIIETSPAQEVKNNVAVALKMIDYNVMIYDSARELFAISNFAGNVAGILQEQDWALLRSGEPVLKEWSSADKHYLLIARPFSGRETFFGAVLIIAPTDEVHSTLNYIRSILLLAGLGAILMIFGFTNMLVPKLSYPLLAMEKAMREIAKGNLHIKLNEKSHDELGTLARAINDLVADLKRLQNSRREFFANIAHELRTPLTYIEGYVKLLDEAGGSEEQRGQAIQIIVDETQRLKGLVDDLFELAQIEEGKVALTLEWVDLSEIIETSIEKVKLYAMHKGITISVAEDDVPILLLDGNRMQQVFINLLDNAIRYTNEGLIIIRLNSTPECIVIEIKDTGIGIPAEELPFIFERFHRVEKSRSRNYGGTGLGLAIVKKLVEIQGGAIEVASQLGAGTTFTIKFPKPAEETVP
ncbi:HAMP domain-containing sensor histidine kinase [Sporomusa sp.]|uniref:HAMP domain-containing sensor histidine kinase n=1 Tax=Sporomusa sp. TaxID=2078658 RepID=UPI002BE83463|nr:ATP-binding protein [Sporomusa sp.]HWR42826.1 ATP-binding protein [Sporomusa sp.]